MKPDKIGINDIAKVWKKHKIPYPNPRIDVGTARPTAGKLTL